MLTALLPLALERSALYSPLAVVLIGGLVSSTLLARIAHGTGAAASTSAPSAGLSAGGPRADAPPWSLFSGGAVWEGRA